MYVYFSCFPKITKLGFRNTGIKIKHLVSSIPVALVPQFLNFAVFNKSQRKSVAKNFRPVTSPCSIHKPEGERKLGLLVGKLKVPEDNGRRFRYK